MDIATGIRRLQGLADDLATIDERSRAALSSISQLNSAIKSPKSGIVDSDDFRWTSLAFARSELVGATPVREGGSVAAQWGAVKDAMRGVDEVMGQALAGVPGTPGAQSVARARDVVRATVARMDDFEHGRGGVERFAFDGLHHAVPGNERYREQAMATSDYLRRESDEMLDLQRALATPLRG